MPCDGKNPNCDRRRELLAQLKCLVSSMDRKKPCEWDESPCPPAVYCSTKPALCTSACCEPIKPCKSFDFRASIMYRCECIKRNGLQDRCMMWDCMGRPECMTKLYPVCEPGRAALSKLTDLDDVEVALKRFYCADQARETALARYCRLACADARQKQTIPCNISNKIDDSSDGISWNRSVCCREPSAYRVYIPSPAYSNCYVSKSCCVLCHPPCKLAESCPPCVPPAPTCVRYYLPACLPCVPRCSVI